MSPSLSWIDPEDLERALGPRLFERRRPGGAAPPAAEPAQPPPGPAARPGSPEPPPAPPTTSRRPPAAEPPEIVAAGAAQTVLAPLPIEATRSDLAAPARVQALARWAEANLRPERWFLADLDGLTIHDGGLGDDRIAQWVDDMRPWRLRRIGSVTYHLEDGGQLVALWARAEVGPIAVGLENPATDAVETIRSAVERTLGVETQR